MKYFDLQGGYYDALLRLKADGGQLFVGNGKDSAVVVVQGQTCFTYWQKGSKRYQEVKQLAENFRLDTLGKTGGRLARWLVSDFLALPYKDTFWQRNYRELAKKGNHWHYMHCEPWKSFIGCEFDLKSAYLSSYFQGKSMLYQSGIGWLDDGGALENLKAINHQLPKWFRLQLLGTMASWKIQFYTRNKLNPDSDIPVLNERKFIDYGAAFNAVHRAILRNYKIMEKIHQIGGEHIKRMHTDSFTLSLECPEKTERKIFDYLESKGLQVDIKNCGKAFFFDVNCGFIGRFFVGSKNDVVELMRENNLKMHREKINKQVQDRFGERLENSNFMEKISNLDNSKEENEQLELFNISGYKKSYPPLERIA